MKRSILITLLILLHLPGFSQGLGAPVAKGSGKIFGTVVDSTNNQGVPFATIALNDPSTNKPVNGTICKEDGKFELEKVAEGDYQVAVTFIGYKTTVINNIRVSNNEEVNLGRVILSPAVTLLKEVTVEGQKSLIEEKVDRTVYNAEVDQTNKGGDATDVLRKVPMLSVDMDGNPSLRGSSGVKVLINNRPSTIAASSIADALKQIPAEMIKSVEVITSPSARYDAEGSAGIINIITKKNTLQGFSLGIDAGAGLRGSNLGLNGSYRKGKMGFSLGGFGRAGYNITGSFKNAQETVTDGKSFQSIQNADTRTNNVFGRYQFGWDYDINEKNFLTASVQFGLRNNQSFQDKLTTLSYQNNTFSRSDQFDVNTEDLSNNLDVNLNYVHTLKKPQEEFSVLAQYSRNNRTNDFLREYIESSDGFGFNTKNLNESYNEEITLQADYQNPITKTQMLEVGAKQILRNVTSDFSTYMTDENGNYVLQTDRGSNNIFNYDQNVSAAYLSYTLGFLKDYTLKAGMRYEYTVINAKLEDESDRGIPAYGSLVPSVNISKRLKNGNMIKAAYNRRIQRPSIQFLNPNIQGGNSRQVTIGNPDLSPEYTNNFELGYNTRYKIASISLTAFVRNTNNSIESIRNPEGDTIVTRYGNIGLQNAYGSSLFINFNLSNKLSINGGGDVFFSELKNNVPDPAYNASNQGWTANFRAFGNYTIGKGWGLQLFSFYRLRQIQLQGTQGGFGIYSLSVKKDFNNKRGSIGFGAENFFTSKFKIKNELNSPLINQNSTNVMHNMNFKINLSYRIGKINGAEQSRRRKRSVSNDDLKDGGDADGGSMQQGGGAPAGGGGMPQGGMPPMGGNRQIPGGGQPAGPGAGQGQKQFQGQGSNPQFQKPQTEEKKDAEKVNTTSDEAKPSEEEKKDTPSTTPAGEKPNTNTTN